MPAGGRDASAGASLIGAPGPIPSPGRRDGHVWHLERLCGAATTLIKRWSHMLSGLDPRWTLEPAACVLQLMLGLCGCLPMRAAPRRFIRAWSVADTCVCLHQLQVVDWRDGQASRVLATARRVGFEALAAWNAVNGVAAGLCLDATDAAFVISTGDRDFGVLVASQPGTGRHAKCGHRIGVASGQTLCRIQSGSHPS